MAERTRPDPIAHLGFAEHLATISSRALKARCVRQRTPEESSLGFLGQCGLNPLAGLRKLTSVDQDGNGSALNRSRSGPLLLAAAEIIRAALFWSADQRPST